MSQLLHSPFPACRILACILFCLSPLQAFELPAKSGISWDKQVIQLPLEPSESFAEAWFTFSNETASVIRIVDVQSDCDCLVPKMDRSVYYPGESGILIARVEVKQDESVVERRVIVSSRIDDRDAHSTELIVIARRQKD